MHAAAAEPLVHVLRQPACEFPDSEVPSHRVTTFSTQMVTERVLHKFAITATIEEQEQKFIAVPAAGSKPGERQKEGEAGRTFTPQEPADMSQDRKPTLFASIFGTRKKTEEQVQAEQQSRQKLEDRIREVLTVIETPNPDHA